MPKRISYTLNPTVSSKRAKVSDTARYKYVEDGCYYMGRAEATRCLYRDINGYYVPEVGEQLMNRFEVLLFICNGMFSTVVLAMDHKLKNIVTIKILRWGDEFMSRRVAEVEVSVFLRECYGDDELSIMKGYFQFRNHTFIVYKACESDVVNEWKYMLYLNETCLKKVVRGVARQLERLHHVQLSNFDIRPNNIAFRKEHERVEIIHMATAQHGIKQCMDSEVFRNGKPRYTAPEEAFHLPYGPGVDVWALACSAFKFAVGYSLFKENNPNEYFASLIEVLGLPPLEMIKSSHVADRFFSDDGSFLLCSSHFSEPSALESGLRRVVPCSNNTLTLLSEEFPDFVDFLRKCLTWDPSKRPSITEVLNHSWLKYEEDTLNRKFTVPPPIPSFAKRSRGPRMWARCPSHWFNRLSE